LFDDIFRQLVAARGRPLILGHRGSPHHARENTLASFWLALKAGADGIELDVHRTADGVLVAHHDDELPTHEPLAGLSYKDLMALAKQSDVEIPVIGDVFKVVAGRGFLNIELKTSGFEEDVMALARAVLPAGSFAFSSFDPRAVARCRQIAADVPALLITWGARNGEADLALLAQLDSSGIACESPYLTDELAALYRAHHYPLFAWTVNDVAEARRLAAAGVAGLITDTPDLLIAAFR
jgi:glycerophosphoryl diester phosphodiesterase